MSASGLHEVTQLQGKDEVGSLSEPRGEQVRAGGDLGLAAAAGWGGGVGLPGITTRRLGIRL